MAAFSGPDRGPGVIGALRQQPPQVDAVGGAQPYPFTQAGVGESLLDQPLAVVEGAAHGQRLDVVVPAAEVVLLARRNPPLGKQHDHADLLAAGERRSHGRPGIARSGDQDGQRRRGCRFFGEDALQACRQEARPVVLERRGGAVKQLQQLQARAVPRGRQIGQGKRIGEGVAADFRQGAGQGRTRKVGSQHAFGQLRRRGGLGQRGALEHRQALGHVQAAVGRGAGLQHCFEPGGSAAAGAEEGHHDRPR